MNYIYKYKRIAGAVLAAGIMASSCQDEEYDLKNISTDQLTITTALDAPVAQTTIQIRDLLLHEETSGILELKDSTYNIKDITTDEDIPLPDYITSGTLIESSDTIKDIEMEDFFGKGEIIDSLIFGRLKFNIVNQLPFAVDLTMHFYSADTIDAQNIQFVEDTTLRRSFTVKPCKINQKTKACKHSTEANLKIDFDGKDNQSLLKLKRMIIEYKLSMDEIEEFYLLKDAYVSLDFSAYLKARLLLTD